MRQIESIESMPRWSEIGDPTKKEPNQRGDCGGKVACGMGVVEVGIGKKRNNLDKRAGPLSRPEWALAIRPNLSLGGGVRLL